MLWFRKQVAISSGISSGVISTVGTGEICGEASLLSARPHSVTAKAVKDIAVAELHRRDLGDLIRRRPNIGVIIYRNLAVGLGDKLLRSGDWKQDQEGMKPKAFSLRSGMLYAGRTRPFFGSRCCGLVSTLGK